MTRVGVVLFIVSGVLPLCTASVQPTWCQLTAGANDYWGPDAYEQVLDPPFPFYHDVLLVDGALSNHTVYALDNADTPRLNVVWEHARPPVNDDNDFFAIHNAAEIRFETTALTPYRVEGRYVVTGSVNANLNASLWDVTDAELLYYWEGLTQGHVDNPVFVLDGHIAGDLEGVLVPGHLYRWTFNVYQSSYELESEGATAIGHVNLWLPEPGARILLLFGVLLLRLH